MKKRLLYIAAILICLSIITGGTFAYFTTDDIAHNVITTKKVKFDVLCFAEDNGMTSIDNNVPIRIMPATKVSRVVAAQSIETAAWVRLKYKFMVYDSNGNQMDISEDELKEIIIVTPDETNWILKDGWWHYNAMVKDGEKTTPLFEEIEFSGPGMGNEYQNGKVKLILHGQAVQYANNGETVMEADGWPEE